MANKPKPKATKPASPTEQAPVIPAVPETVPVVTAEGQAPIAAPDAQTEPFVPLVVPPIDPPVAPAAIPKLRDYIREHEDAADALGVVVAQITHPDAPGGVMQGRYSGIRTAEGNPSATYSDGSKH